MVALVPRHWLCCGNSIQIKQEISILKSIQTIGAAALLVTALSTPVHAQYTADKAGLADAIHDYTIGSWWETIIFDKLMSFKLSPGCWAKMTEKDGWGISTTTNFARALNDYTKNGGMPNLEEVESANNNDRANNKPRVEQQVDAMKNKVSFTLQADGIKCSDAEWDLFASLYEHHR